MECKYVLELKNECVFKNIEEKYGVIIPKDFVGFIKKYNAGVPDKYHVKIHNIERVVSSILSFNEDEEDTDSVFLAFDVLNGRKLLPFAIDPFGNYFCYMDGRVVFFNHEESSIDESNMTIAEFIKNMY